MPLYGKSWPIAMVDGPEEIDLYSRDGGMPEPIQGMHPATFRNRPGHGGLTYRPSYTHTRIADH